MGQLIGNCKFDCCINNKRNKISTRSSYYSNSEGDDNELEQIQYSRFCVTETPKATIDFPVKVKNLFFEHFSNPWTT